MKIALLDPLPRIGHTWTWVQHTTTALRAAGHDVDHITSTKSGRALNAWGTAKWGTAWTPARPDVVVKDSDLPGALAGYERVVLISADHPTLDGPAVKRASRPVYIDALLALERPWTMVVQPGTPQGPGNDESTPFLAPLTDLYGAQRARRVIIHDPAAAEPERHAAGCTPPTYVPLPYLPALDIDAPLPDGRTVTTTGLFDRGHANLTAATIHLGPDDVLEAWGAGETGTRANASWAQFEQLLPYATGALRRAGQDEPAPPDAPHGARETPFTWDVRLRSGALVRYLGNYIDPVTTAARGAVWAAASTLPEAAGDSTVLPLDYPTLEALDAGCLCLLQGARLDPRLRALVLDHTGTGGGSGWRRPLADPETTAAGLRRLLGALDNTAWRTDVTAGNRAALREIYDPAPLVAALTA